MAKVTIIKHNTKGLGSESNPVKTSKLGVNFFERGSLLYIRLTLDGQKREKSLGINLKPGTLQNKYQSITGDPENTALIKAIHADIYSNTSKRRVLEIELNLDAILSEVLSGKGLLDSVATFQSLLAEAFNEKVKKYESGNLIEKTYKRYVLEYRVVSEYFMSVFKSGAIRLESIKYYHVSKYIEYLISTLGFESETVRKYIKLGSRSFVLAKEKGIYYENPFIGHPLPRTRNYSHNHLTEDELKAFYALELNNIVYTEVRDFFVFQCYTGLNYVDLQALKHSDLEIMDRGSVISIKRSKTGTDVFIPLLPVPLGLLERYAGVFKDKCFPIPTNQQYNRVLKELSELSGLDKKLTTSFARKTFINLAFDLGMDIDSIGIIVGHKAAKTAYKHYIARQSPNRAFDAMEALKSKLK